MTLFTGQLVHKSLVVALRLEGLFYTLFFRTAEQHMALGSPMLALGVLSR